MSRQTGKDDLWYKQQIKWLKDRLFDFGASYDCHVKWMLNDTGAASVRGTLVEASANVDFAVEVLSADGNDCIGSVLKDDIADGEMIPIGYGGCVPVLLEDGTAATRHYWARSSLTVPGRAIINTASAPGGGVAAIDRHFKEIGHGANSVGASTDVIAYIHMHFN